VCTNVAGNESFKQKKYHEAAMHYTQALKMNPKDPRVSILALFGKIVPPLKLE
jgi:hypothetical protein